jgi:hypothetical protein
MENIMCILTGMVWVFILGALTLFIPVFSLILRSMNVLKTTPSAYYDFTVIFQNTKPWAVGLYIVVIAVLTFVVFFFSGIPLLNLSA